MAGKGQEVQICSVIPDYLFIGARFSNGSVSDSQLVRVCI